MKILIYPSSILQLSSLANEIFKVTVPKHKICGILLQVLWVKILILPQLNPIIIFLFESNIQGNDNVLLNHILLLSKKFIYDKKNHPARIHFLSIMNYVKEVEKMEQKIAHRKG